MVRCPRGGDSEKMAAYNSLARNKRSIVLNLREAEAREIFYKLADEADVVLEGFRPGVVKRLGVDFETLRARNPRIVYCSLSGFGPEGQPARGARPELHQRRGADDRWPASRPRSDEHHRGLRRGGLHALRHAALFARRTGRSQYVDIAMTEARCLCCRA
jgi:crotonobetainyl-CoA:carnitine CoA-transferase CaiB-like acyl-CoA transferase